jgi:hypothetical protein
MTVFWMKNHLVSDSNCNTVNYSPPKKLQGTTNNVGLTISINNRVIGFDKIYSLELLILYPSFLQMYSFVVVCIVRSTCGDPCMCNHTMVWENLKALEFLDQTQLKLKLHLQNMCRGINKNWIENWLSLDVVMAIKSLLISQKNT